MTITGTRHYIVTIWGVSNFYILKKYKINHGK